MFASKDFFVTIPFLYLGLYIFSRIADMFHPYFQQNRNQFKNYNRAVVAIMVAIVCIVATAQTFKYVLKTIHIREKNNNEIYSLKNADYNIYFQDEGSANVEHILQLQRNDDVPNINKIEDVIKYEFDEINDISGVHIFVNDKELEKSSTKASGTFTTHLENKINRVDIYLPNKDKEIRLKVSYYVKNSLSKIDDGYFTYYNRFLAHRSRLSYNTQFKGNIRFFMPEDSRYDFAGYCKDMYVETKGMGNNVASIYFENKLKHNFYTAKYSIDSYDGITWWDKYFKDFSISVRADFFMDSPYRKQQVNFENKLYTIDELKKMSEDKKKDYSDFLFTLNIILKITIYEGMLPYLFIMFPIIRWYYKKKLNEYWEYILNGN